MRDLPTQRQIDAALPGRSTWLSANAGSGKTKVLTDRVARLLLEGVDPQHILCLTFTKAAAAEMQNRLFERLGAWAMLPDAKLRKELESLGIDGEISTQELGNARRLFAIAIETPGGLKIQTIHSFCSSLLRRFPLEAGISPNFVEMDERADQKLREEIIESIASGTERDSLHALARQFSGESLASLTQDIAKHRDAFRKMCRKDIYQALNLPEKASEALALHTAFDGTESVFWPQLLELMRSIGGAFYPAMAERLATVDIQAPKESDLETLFDLFLYKSSSGSNLKWSSKSTNFPQSNHKNAIAQLTPIIDQLHAFMDRVSEAKQVLLALETAQKTVVLHDFATVFLKTYQEAKLRQAQLDFDDLILKARDLLTDRKVADWVLYKLDGGIDHILIDEAQDNSPEQWDLIERLTSEFTAGQGAQPDKNRTIFVVGDKKQSIYSFQGADPDGFDRMKADFSARLAHANTSLQDMEMEYSFRSAHTILQAVDQTFSNHKASGFTQREPHKAFKAEMPGRVDLWPVFEKPKTPEPPDWYMPVDVLSEDDPATELARSIAHQIKSMIGTPLPNDDSTATRLINAGDVLILVQRRSKIFHEIIRECKALGLPVAGSDRLRVTAELAVRDLLALLSFLATPEDDLSLAAVLRSPLFGWSEAELFDLAHARKQKYLWAELRDRKADFAETVSILDDLRDRADFLRPYDLLERSLTRHRGRHLLLSRLGTEAEDGIDALLGLAMTFESRSVDSLTGFLVWMEADKLEIKRQMDAAGDRIRVMTVHGAKGLESPIVILPDCAKRDVRLDSQIVVQNKLPFWRPAKDDLPAALRDARDAELAMQNAERDRLLYVAMTRAEQWLIVAAAGDLDKEKADWYSKVQAGLLAAQAEAHDFANGTGLRLEDGAWPATMTEDASSEEGTIPKLPEVFAKTVSNPDKIKEVLTPSDLGGAKALPSDEGQDEAAAKQRGRQIHTLLEHLPSDPPDQWPSRAEDLLSSGPDQAESQKIAHLLAEASEVLATPALAFLFAQDSLAEVTISAPVEALSGRRIHGIVDRLIFSNDKVLIVDFKTNAAVPESPEACPEGLLRQMGAYAHALQQIYPGRQVETALLWTRTATLMRLPHDLVTDALHNTHIS
nr:double-strand break repair helicase AddA [Roseovarius sp. W115]MDV2930025.1 double-strand break repair helicase AddA [Roseovarius sp. W115]